MELNESLVRAVLDDEVDLYDVLAGTCPLATDRDVGVVVRMYADAALDTGYHPDDDMDLILEAVRDWIVDAYGEAIAAMGEV